MIQMTSYSAFMFKVYSYYTYFFYYSYLAIATDPNHGTFFLLPELQSALPV